MDNRDRRGGDRRLAGVVAAVAALLLGPTPVRAQTFESIGTRATGMAGAFVAVADDATASYWNPAGLPTGAFLSLLVDRTSDETRLDRSRPGSPGTSETGTIVAMSTNATAFAYYRLRIHSIERLPLPGASVDPASADQQGGDAILRSVVTHNLAVTGAQVVYPGVSVGSTLRYLRGSHGVGAGTSGLTTGGWLHEAGTLERRGQNKIDLDVGLKVSGEWLHAGVVARNLLEPSLDGPNGERVRLDRQYRAGVAVRPGRGLLVAADIDLNRLATAYGDRRNVAIGAEQWFGLWLGVRGGARFNLDGADGDRRPVGAFGLSVALTAGVYVDGQLTRGRDEGERGWSIAGRIGF